MTQTHEDYAAAYHRLTALAMAVEDALDNLPQPGTSNATIDADDVEGLTQAEAHLRRALQSLGGDPEGTDPE